MTIALMTALARPFRQGDHADIDTIVALMARADALGGCGVGHDLVAAGFANQPPALALAVVVRLLQDCKLTAVWVGTGQSIARVSRTN